MFKWLVVFKTSFMIWVLKMSTESFGTLQECVIDMLLCHDYHAPDLDGDLVRLVHNLSTGDVYTIGSPILLEPGAED